MHINKKYYQYNLANTYFSYNLYYISYICIEMLILLILIIQFFRLVVHILYKLFYKKFPKNQYI